MVVQTAEVLKTADLRAGTSSATPFGRRAHDLYLARAREPGHHVDDWWSGRNPLDRLEAAEVGTSERDLAPTVQRLGTGP